MRYVKAQDPGSVPGRDLRNKENSMANKRKTQPVTNTARPSASTAKYTVAAVAAKGSSGEIWVFPGDGDSSSLSAAILRSATDKSDTVVYKFDSWSDMNQAVLNTEPLKSCGSIRVMCQDAIVAMQGPAGSLLPPEDVLQSTFNHSAMTPDGVKTALQIKCDADNPEGRIVEQHPELLKDFVQPQEPKRVERVKVSPAVERLCAAYAKLGGGIDSLASLLESFT